MTDDHKEIHAVDGIVEDRQQRPPVYFYLLFFGLIIWGTIFMAYYLFSGWSSDAEFQEKMAAHQAQVEAVKPAAGSVAPAAVDAAALYAEHCAVCHGDDGKGGIGPDLTLATYAYGRSTAAVHDSIAEGREGGMPAFANQISGPGIDALTTYLLNLK